MVWPIDDEPYFLVDTGEGFELVTLDSDCPTSITIHEIRSHVAPSHAGPDGQPPQISWVTPAVLHGRSNRLYGWSEEVRKLVPVDVAAIEARAARHMARVDSRVLSTAQVVGEDDTQPSPSGRNGEQDSDRPDRSTVPPTKNRIARSRAWLKQILGDSR